MNNSELIDYVSANSGVLKKDAKVAVSLLAKAIGFTLRRGGSVTFAGVGVFKVKRVPASVRRNPRNQAVINVAAKKKAKFQACRALDDFINGR